MRWDITLNQRGFLLDTSDDSGFAGPISVPLLRGQADTSSRPGGSALNRDDAWRTWIRSWHKGAGQRVYDAPDSDEFRFWESSGVNVWEKNRLSLLHGVAEVLDNTRGTPTPRLLVMQDGDDEVLVANTGAILVAEITGGSDTGYPEDSGDFRTITSTNSVLDIATDGQTIWATDGSDVFEFELSDSSVGSAWNTLDCERLWYVMGRLMAAEGPAIYNITSSSPPSAHFTHGNTGFVWTDMSAASGFIYAVGHAPGAYPTIEQRYVGQSEVYRITLKDDGTGLDAPIPCGALPQGEIAQAVLGYAGFVLVGTNRGIRLAQPDANGNLNFGRNLPVGSVWSLMGHDRFVWAGIEVTGGNSKLWRLDLSEFTSPLTPAYAEDLKSPTETVIRSRVTSIAHFGERTVYLEATGVDVLGTEQDRYFLYLESDLYRDDAYIDLGQVTFEVTDQKTALSGEVRYEPVPDDSVSPNPAELQVYWDYLSDPDPITTTDAIDDGSTLTTFDDASVIGTVHSSARIVLLVNPIEVNDGLNSTYHSPVITSFTWRARPTPARALEYHLPILLADRYRYDSGGVEGRSVAGDLAFVSSLVDDGACTLNIFGSNVVGFVEEFRYRPAKKSSRRSQAQQFDGVLDVKFKVVS